jgi:DNA-binding MarR family transcriptional regulator
MSHEEAEEEQAVHTIADVLRNALSQGFTTIKPLLAFIEIASREEHPFPAEMEELLGMTPTNFGQLLNKQLKALGVAVDYRDPITRSRRLAPTEHGLLVFAHVTDGTPMPEEEGEEETA